MKPFNFYLTIFKFSCILFSVFLTNVAQADADKVVVGVYVNDVQAIDLRTHSYVVDLYLWFRWKNAETNPSETFEFMNTFDPEAHVEEMTYDEPQAQPDGSQYAILRHQGAFSAKFNVAKFPFDQHELIVAVEDAEYSILDQIYIPDDAPIVMNENIKLPGYIVGEPRLDLSENLYATNFGDLNEADQTVYSRAAVVIPLERPIMSGIIKSFLPIFLVVMSAALALLLDPAHVEARVGLTITALLALVALQFTATNSLPEVGYLLMIEQIYIASYLYILATIAIVVRGTRMDEQGAIQAGAGSLARLAERGVNTALILTAIYIFALIVILLINLYVF